MKLISDSILVGFRAGAGLTIAMTQLPSLLGVAGGGHNFFERSWLLLGQLDQTHYVVLLVGVFAIALLVLGEQLLPGKPVALGVVTLAIVAATMLGLPSLGVPTTGKIPPGLPTLAGPALRLRDVEGIVPLAVARVSQPNIAFLGRIPDINHYSDRARHPENEALTGAIAFRPEASLI